MISRAAAGWALAGAALASAAIYVVPALTPAHGPEAIEGEPAAAPAQAGGGVSLDSKAIARAGIRIVALKPASNANERTGFARTLDLSPLAAINAEILAARAALSASDAEATRQQALAAQDQSASVRVVESARAQARADRARLTLALRRIGLEYGSGLSRLDSGLDGLVAQAASGQAALVRLDFQDGVPPAGSIVTISDANVRTTVRIIGPAVAADAGLQSAGALAIVRGPLARSLAVGRVMAASIADTGSLQSGAIVPRDAIVRTRGGLWVYRVEPGGQFRRVELLNATARQDGWFVPTGLRPGDRVATGGTAVLLGIESGPPTEDE